jgi:hypothetical protein
VNYLDSGTEFFNRDRVNSPPANNPNGFLQIPSQESHKLPPPISDQSSPNNANKKWGKEGFYPVKHAKNNTSSENKGKRLSAGMTSKINKLFLTNTKKRDPLSGGANNVKLGQQNYDGQTNKRLVSIGDDPYVFGTEKMKKILAKKVDSGKVDELNKTRTRIYDDGGPDVSRSNFGGDGCKSPVPKKNILTDEFMDRQNLWLKKKKTREPQGKLVTVVNLSKKGKVTTSNTGRGANSPSITGRGAKSPSITGSKLFEAGALTGKNRSASKNNGRGFMTPGPKGSAPLKKKPKKSFGEASGLTNIFQGSQRGSIGSECHRQMLGLIGGIDGGNQIIQGMWSKSQPPGF